MSENQTPDTPVDETSVGENPRTTLHFHLILAEVIFETERGANSMRTQFVTQAPTQDFPADRIRQLQNSAAATIRQQIIDAHKGRVPKKFIVHDVLFLGMNYCGEMTPGAFYGKGVTVEADVKVVEEAIAAAETHGGGNVVPFPPPASAETTPSTDGE